MQVLPFSLMFSCGVHGLCEMIFPIPGATLAKSCNQGFQAQGTDDPNEPGPARSPSLLCLDDPGMLRSLVIYYPPCKGFESGHEKSAISTCSHYTNSTCNFLMLCA